MTGITAATPTAAPHGLEAPPVAPGEPKLSKAEERAQAKEEAKFSEFVVMLDDQGQRTVEKAFDMPVGVERRQYVAKSLIDNMVKTQGPLWKVLDGLQSSGHVSQTRGYTPLWIQNSIVVYGDDTAKSVMESAAGVAQAVKSATHVLDNPGRYEDQLAPLENAVSGAEALADLPADVDHIAKGATKGGGGKAVAKRPDLATDPQWNLNRIHVDAAHKDGLTGKGVVVGSLDTGVDFTHPALLSKYRGYDPETGEVSHVGNWYDATDEKSPVPVDGHGHGTHTTGTMVGGYNGFDVGVAPDAQWVAARGLGEQGGTDGMLLTAFQNMVAPKVPDASAPGGAKRVVALGPDIINNSWGSDAGQSTSYMHALRNMDAMGVVNFFAAGNDGEAGAGTIGSPGSSPHIITVGATDRTDTPASFSSRGPNPLPVENGEPVPFIAMPGTEIRSAKPGGGYQQMQGTSMATPLAAGMGALVDQAALELTGRTFDTRAMKEVLKRAAVDIQEKGPDDATGYGIPVADHLRKIVADVAKDLGLLDAKAAKAAK
ncbi:MAG: serine protease [Thermoleophilia bacterium]|nr:serine protease [Thermoleophilia bacterium]